MWTGPYYFIDEAGKAAVDVTKSAPSFKNPGKVLEKSLEILLETRRPERTHVLDFGAGKLRNTLYLLEKGYNVTACEFRELFDSSIMAMYNLAKAEEDFKFIGLLSPNEIDGFVSITYDVILLINVLSVMPVPEERKELLRCCRDKCEDDSLLFFKHKRMRTSDLKYAKPARDGYIKKVGDSYTFYKPFSKNEILDLMENAKFKLNEDFKFKHECDIAMVFSPMD